VGPGGIDRHCGLCRLRYNAAPAAIIVDQLQHTHPNPDFVEEATAILDGAGFSVAYVPGDQVTVDFFRTLPQRQDDLVILRVHSALRQEVDSPSDDVSLFTGEYVDLRNFELVDVSPAVATAVTEARRRGVEPESGVMNASVFDGVVLGHIGPVFYEPGEQELPKFGIRPTFFEEAAHGDFDGSTVLVMGCDGLRSDGMAKALIGRGASNVVGWTDAVSAEHTDAATIALLRALYEDARPLSESVDEVMATLGEDPHYGARLRVYRP
jgi:hypothetical protein